MSNDIVAQLRKEGFITHMGGLSRESKLLHEAADEIERLRVQRDEARRQISHLMGGTVEQEWFANRMGWDCFNTNKEN